MRNVNGVHDLYITSISRVESLDVDRS